MARRKLTILVLMMASLIALAASYLISDYQAYQKRLGEYNGINLGATMKEAAYVFGWPLHVIASKPSGDWLAHRVYQVDGNDPKNLLPKGPAFGHLMIGAIITARITVTELR
jgi:hypothetical protein